MFENISTNWQWHKFLFIGGSSMPWWNWEMIQRNGWKVIQRLVENSQTRFFCDVRTRATNQVRRADQWQKLYGDNLFDVELVRVAGYLWPWIPRCSGILQVGTNYGQISNIFSFLRTTICITPNKVKSPSCLKADKKLLEICSCHGICAVRCIASRYGIVSYWWKPCVIITVYQLAVFWGIIMLIVWPSY